MSSDNRSALAVGAPDAARLLLGWTLVVVGTAPGEPSVSGRIVETEAYEGTNDPASHAANGPTARNQVMFGEAGALYVYRSYGIHWCANVVCESEGTAGAVLIRALEPMSGVQTMWPRRAKARTERDLCSGPGKLCAALGINGDHYGVDLLSEQSPVVLTPPRRSLADGRESIVSGPRIGISKAVDRPLRFGIAGSPHLSRPFPQSPAAARTVGDDDRL